MDMKSYILVTPCKNEEESLPKLAESIINQTITPKLWVIVDDGSTDGTVDIIKDIIDKYEWIKDIRIEEGFRDLGIHVSDVCRRGFDFAIDHCMQHGSLYYYIGLVDADIILEYKYFEKLVYEFEKNPNLGIASGRGANIIGNKVVQDKQRDDLPTGGARFWRKECFEDTGGYASTRSPDSVSNVKAILGGWGTKQFDHISFVSTRAHASAEGCWKGYKQFGANNYFIGYTPIHVLLKGLKLLIEEPYYTGFAYLYGYFGSLIFRENRLDDDDVRYYFRCIRPHEIRRYYVNRLMNIFRIENKRLP